MKIGNREFDNRGHYIWGILNVTPDSFSDGGKYNEIDMALKHAEEMIQDGADIIDIGGESTRPGYTLLSEEEEIHRVVPVLQRIKAEFDIPVSVDTYKSQVAEAVLSEGADLVNDIWGLKWDDSMAKVIGKYQVPCCLMHNRKEADYQDLMADVVLDLEESLHLAINAGIRKENIILDPGIGFGKTYEDNLEVLRNLEKLQGLGCQLLLGTSRKSVIGMTLDLPKDEREEGTHVTTVLGMVKGYQHFRVHNVKGTKRTILMAESIL